MTISVQPATGISRASVRDIEKVLPLRTAAGAEQLYAARLACVVDLPPGGQGDRVGRLEETLGEVIAAAVAGPDTPRPEALVCRVARDLREREGVDRAEVTIEARHPERKPAPVSGIATQELHTVFATAVDHAGGTRRLVGVSAQGMLASPGPQAQLAARARERLAEEGFDGDEVERILAAVPVATEDHRGFGTLQVGLPEDSDAEVRPDDLLAIVEEAMSSEIYELMKRSDESAVVQRAHARPRTVEDCVAEMIAGVLARYDELPDTAFVLARQESSQTIRRHTVAGEHAGLLGTLRAQAAGGRDGAAPATLRAWLDLA